MPGASGMKMYSREDLMNSKFGGGEEDDDDDEEDDFSEKLVCQLVPASLSNQTRSLRFYYYDYYLLHYSGKHFKK